MTCSHTIADLPRCTKPATHWLLCDGERVPGQYMCRAHAQAVLDEYRAHADIVEGTWTAEAIDWLGTRVEAAGL